MVWFFIPTDFHTGTESSVLPTCPLKIKRTTPPVPCRARGPNNTYKKLKWTSVHLSPMPVTCCTPTFPYQIVWKCMGKGNSAGEGESWDCERTATPANWAVRGPVGNEQCRQEIKEWEKGERKRAEVSRSRTATSHLSSRRGRSSGAGGRWRQSHPVPLPSFGMLPCTPVTPTATLAPISFPRSPPFSFVLDFSHLTCALTQNERISFTSSRAQNYTEGQMIKCHKHREHGIITQGSVSGNQKVESAEKERYLELMYSMLTHLKIFKIYIFHFKMWPEIMLSQLLQQYHVMLWVAVYHFHTVYVLYNLSLLLLHPSHSIPSLPSSSTCATLSPPAAPPTLVSFCSMG